MNKNRYLVVAIAIALTAIFSISTHALILQYFHAPIVKIPPFLNTIIGVAIRFGMVAAPMFIYACSRDYWESINLVYRIILFAVLLLALTEQLFRFSIMKIIVGAPWEYQILSSIPTYLGYLTISVCVCLFLKKIMATKHFKFLYYLIFASLVTTLLIIVLKLSHNFITPLLNYVPQPRNSIQPPYDFDVLIPAYITFLEPTVAAFIVFYLIKETLSTLNTLNKGLVLAGIIMVIHAGIYSIVQIIYSEGNVFYRIFYYGQFLWEYLALGILTAYSYALFKKLLQGHCLKFRLAAFKNILEK